MSKKLQWITPIGVIATYSEEGYFEYELKAKYARDETVFFWDHYDGADKWRMMKVGPEWEYTTLITALGPRKLNLKGTVDSEQLLPTVGNQIGDGYILSEAGNISTTSLKYKIISGKLGDGLQMYPNGKIQGVPVIEGFPTATTLSKFSQTLI